MPSTCQFEFDRPDVIYSSGETISGHIILRTTKPKAVNGNKTRDEAYIKTILNNRIYTSKANLY